MSSRGSTTIRESRMANQRRIRTRARMNRAFSHGGVVLCLLGCGREAVPISSLVPQLPPFDTLGNLRLPATIREISQQRRRAVPARSVGLREQLSEGEFLYVASELDMGSEEVDPGAKVSEIQYVQRPATDSAASIEWANRIREIGKVVGIAPNCVRGSGIARPSRGASWVKDRTRIVLRQIYADSARNNGKLVHIAPMISVAIAVQQPDSALEHPIEGIKSAC